VASVINSHANRKAIASSSAANEAHGCKQYVKIPPVKPDSGSDRHCAPDRAGRGGAGRSAVKVAVRRVPTWPCGGELTRQLVF
jgi:hypothetical protein